jgi:CHAD domain-containing protein
LAETVAFDEFVTGQSSRLLEKLASQVNTALHSRDADSVHDVRVAVRRFAQAVAVFKPYFHSRQRQKIRRELKEIMGHAGEVRDRDIAIGLLAETKATEAAALETKFRVQRDEAEAVLLAVLRKWKAKGSPARWRDKLFPVQPATETPERLLVPLARKFFRAGERASAKDSSVTDLHRFRIRSKKFRYSVELFRDIYGPVAEEWIGQIKRLQTLLGDMNDFRVTRELIEELEPDTPIAAAFGKKQEKKADAFRKLWKDEYSGAGAGWIRAFERQPRKPVGRAGAATRQRRKTVTA